MIEQIEGLPAGVLGFRARGQLTAADYERVLVPDIEAGFALNRKLRLLFHVPEDFGGLEPRAMWDDAKLGLRHFSGWDRLALVTDIPWLRTTTAAMRFLVPAELRVFSNAQLAQATAWIAEPRAAEPA